jgi:hypothetical protein
MVVFLILVKDVNAVFNSTVVPLASKLTSLYSGEGKSNLKYAFGLGSSTMSHEQNKNISI